IKWRASSWRCGSNASYRRSSFRGDAKRERPGMANKRPSRQGGTGRFLNPANDEGVLSFGPAPSLSRDRSSQMPGLTCKGRSMARTDAIVLGAGIVGVSVALHLVKRGLAVTLVDRGEPGRGTSYGNAGIIEANTLFPAAFPASLKSLIRIALKWAPE